MCRGKVINPPLYELLQKKCGKVLIHNPGARATVYLERKEPILVHGEPMTQRRVAVRSGEYYSVCCPFCSDSRYRLWVHHMYGQDDPFTGQTMWHLAVCYNERCDMSQMSDWLAGVPYTRIAPEAVTDHEPGLVYVDPGTTIPLGDLPVHHPALAYLRHRRYDPLWLGSQFGFRWTMNTDYRWTDRIWCPVDFMDKRSGWQVRDIQGRLPKYYTMPGFRKNTLLWPHDQLVKHYKGRPMKLLILVEGIFDALRLWPYAVCCFGNSLSNDQAKVVAHLVDDGTVLVGFDPDWIGRPEEILDEDQMTELPEQVRNHLYSQAFLNYKGRAPLTDVINVAYNIRCGEFTKRRNDCLVKLRGQCGCMGVLDLPAGISDPDELPDEMVPSVIANAWRRCGG